MSWRIKWPHIDWLSIFGHNFARNNFAWTPIWVLISTESFLFLPFWLSSEQPAFGVAPTYLTLITNEPWLPGLRWTGHKKDELSRDFLICCGKSRWKKHAAALSSPQSQPKAQTAIASVKANAARRWRGARRLQRAPRHDGGGGGGGFAPDPVFLSKKRMSSVDVKS